MGPTRTLSFPAIPAICTLLTFVTLLFALAVPAAAQKLPVITAIDDSDRVTLAHTTHPLARAGFDLGLAEPSLRMERMLLVLGPSDEVQPQLRALLDSQHDQNSPNYHKWITPEQFGEQFGTSQQDLDKITAWLQQKGFDSIKPARGRGSIEFSGSAQLVQSAFATPMHYYQVGSEKHLANASELSIPRAMSGLVRSVNLENFSFAKPAWHGLSQVTRDADGKLAPIDPQAEVGGFRVLSPGDYAKIYDLNSLYNSKIDGRGVSIAIVARTNILLSDVQAFRQAFNLPPNDPKIIVNGQDPGVLISPDLIESSLDAEWTGAIAPKANIDLVVSQSTATSDGVILSSSYIVDNNLADIMSMSFNACEQNIGSFNAFFNALFQQAAAQGMSVFVATGDSGAADCDANSNGPAQGGLAVNGLASTPFDTAVGGTQFNDAVQHTFWGPVGPGEVSVLGYIPETVWNESCDPSTSKCLFPSLAGTGGGVSAVYSKPSWQSTGILGVPNDNLRDIPDVSLTAAVHDDYIFCAALFGPCSLNTSGNQTQLLSAGSIGGTSASAQAFAGIMALVDQHQGKRQGLANYVLYKLAASENFANCSSKTRTNPSLPAPPGCIFNDITQRNNGVPGNDIITTTPPPGDVVGQLGYKAVPGFDPATGLGSVDGANLVKAWRSVNFRGSTTALSAHGANVTHGQPISFNVKVSPLAGSGTPTGPFSLLTQNAPAPFNGIAVGSGTLTNGAFSGTFNDLPGGHYQVAAHYGGDGTFGGSESAAVTVDVAREASSVALTGGDETGKPFHAPASIKLGFGLGQPLQVTVTSASGNGAPTGTVSLLDGGVAIAELPLNSDGQALFINCAPFSARFCLAKGNHSLTVSYSGDGSLLPSSSQTLNILVNNSPGVFDMLTFCCFTTGTVEIEIDFETGQALAGIPPTGTVTFTDTLKGGHTTLLGPPISLAQGPIILRFFQLVPGTHVITAHYSGDKNYQPLSSNSGPVVITSDNLLPTKTTLMPLTPIVEGQPVKFQVTVQSVNQSSSTPTGGVLVLAGSSTVNFPASFFLTNGSAIIRGIMPNAAETVQAFYFGDSIFDGSTSPPVETHASKINVPVTITSDRRTATAGSQVGLVATVTPPVLLDQPQGLIQFFDSVNGSQPAPLGQTQVLLTGGGPAGVVPGTASIDPVLSTPGVHTITASYSGDTNYIAGQSNALTITISKGP